MGHDIQVAKHTMAYTTLKRATPQDEKCAILGEGGGQLTSS